MKVRLTESATFVRELPSGRPRTRQAGAPSTTEVVIAGLNALKAAIDRKRLAEARAREDAETEARVAKAMQATLHARLRVAKARLDATMAQYEAARMQEWLLLRRHS